MSFERKRIVAAGSCGGTNGCDADLGARPELSLHKAVWAFEIIYNFQKSIYFQRDGPHLKPSTEFKK